MLIYWVSRLIALLILRTVFRMKVGGCENIPQGKVIIASNHVHAADPFVVGMAAPLRVKLSYMAKKELFKNPLVAVVLRQWRVFPVERAAAASAAAALRFAVEFINSGFSLGIFPEGTRSRNGKLGKASLGAAMIAMRTGVPLIPAGVTGTPTMLKSGVRVEFGKPLYPENYSNDREGMQKMTNDMMNQISVLIGCS